MPNTDPFTAKAENFEKTMTNHSGNVGFRVPEYQRTYDWSEEKHKTATRRLSKWILLSLQL